MKKLLIVLLSSIGLISQYAGAKCKTDHKTGATCHSYCIAQGTDGNRGGSKPYHDGGPGGGLVCKCHYGGHNTVYVWHDCIEQCGDDNKAWCGTSGSGQYKKCKCE